MLHRVLASGLRRSENKRRRKTAGKSAARRGVFRAAGWEQLEHRMLLTAATITWTGGSATSDNWSDPANWDLGRAPTNGDSLVFPASASRLANNDDLSGLSVNSITFQGTFTAASSGYTLSGDDLTIGAGGIADSSSISSTNATLSNQIDLNVVLAGSQTWLADDMDSYGQHQLIVNGNVDTNGFTLLAHGTGTIVMDGEISGSGMLSASGVPAGVTNVQPAGSSFGGLTLDLDHANTYTGGTYVGGSTTVVVSADGALGPGGTSDAGTTVDQDGEILFNAINYNTPEAITVNAGTLAGSGSASFSGPITVTGSLTLDGNDTSTTLAGNIAGSGNLIKTGSGTFDLTAKNDFAGRTYVYAGTLVIDGSTAAGNAVTIAAGATLGGTGTVAGTITAVPSFDQITIPPVPGGALDPGGGPDSSKDTGTLSNTGGVALGSSDGGGPTVGFGSTVPSVFAAQLGGTIANPVNDQLDSAGTVSLEFASLDLSTLPGAGPFKAGQQFVIVQAGAPISGTFLDLPEGGTVSDGKQDFTISYANDRVTLTALPPAAGTITWTGGSATSANWSDPANWDLGRAPIDGDSLVFPASASQLANNDDMPGLSVNSITFQGAFSSGYTLSGDALTIGAGGIVDTSSISGNATITNQIDVNLLLAASQNWSIEDTASTYRLAVNGNVANNGFGLTATGVGTIDIAGQISGSGSLHVEGDLVAVAFTVQTIGGGGGGLTLELDHANTYTGGTYVETGTLAVSADAALGPGGTEDAGTTVDPNGEILFNEIAYSTAEAITLNGGALIGAGNSGFSGPITVSGTSPVVAGTPPFDAEILESEPSKTFTLNGPTLTNNGGGNLRVRGDELLPLAGEPPQLFSKADVVINNIISGAGGLTIATGAVALGAANAYHGSTFLQGPATLIINADNAIPGTSAVVMQSYGAPGFSAIELNGHADTIGSLTGTQGLGFGNTVDLGTGGSLTTGGDNTSTNFDGDIIGSGTLTKIGSGTFDLTAKNDFTGTTYVNAGALVIDGSTAAGNAVVVNQGGATLGGTGTVGGTITLSPGGEVISGARISPGTGPDPSKDIATLRNTAGVTFTKGSLPGGSGAAFSVQLGGSSTNPMNDELSSAGTVDLGDAALELSALAGAGPFNAGQQFVIVQAGAPIAGTFDGLSEGSTVSDGRQNFTVSYANDRVTLTALAPPLAASYLNGQPGDGTAATFVHNLYRELLGREPDSAGQTYWANLFAQFSNRAGTAAAQQALVADFLTSYEYRVHLVEGMYEDFLHRAADSAGLAYWASDLAAGMDEKSILANILGSPEYFIDAQGTGIIPDGIVIGSEAEAAKWASSLYRDLLGRAPDAAGLSYWAQQAANQDTPSRRALLAFEFLGAAEVDHKLLNGDYPSAGSVGSPGTSTSGDYALAAITGNGWNNLYFQGKLSATVVDTLFAQLQSGESYGEMIADMLDMRQYLG